MIDRSMQTTIETFALTAAQRTSYYDKGFLGPLTLCSPEEMKEFRRIMETNVLTCEGLNPNKRNHCRHLDQRVIFELVARPQIIDRARSLLGPDLLCWSSNFWTKEPGAQEIPWHQDFNYWPINPPLNLTAWIAVDAVDEENACCRIIPGSHKKIIPHIPASKDKAFSEMADPSYFEENLAESMPLKPGEFFLFNERVLHQSNPNTSVRRRMALAFRITVPFVKVDYKQGPPLFPKHHNILLCGEDRFGLNRYQEPPLR